MQAGIYARKSTEQSGVADEQKSVARQIEHARQYASRKGWTVVDEHVYVDDGISGAEFANRPGFLRLMNALKPRAPFQALIMSEISRLGREQIETARALKQLSTAGVRCFSYLTFTPGVEARRWRMNGEGTLIGLFSREVTRRGSRPQGVCTSGRA